MSLAKYISILRIIARHGTFTMWKPNRNADMEPTDNSPSRVLIVEDEPLIRMSVVGMVEDTGRQTVEAANADDAIRVLTHRSDIGLLFADVEMPGSMNGYELAHIVHERWPDIAIVITSGRMAPDADELPEGGRFIGKPYGPRALARTLSGFSA